MLLSAALAAALACGLPDRGIFPDLDPKVQVQVPPAITSAHTWLRVDRLHAIVTLYDGADPLKAYPIPAAGSRAAPSPASASSRSAPRTRASSPRSSPPPPGSSLQRRPARRTATATGSSTASTCCWAPRS
jgi:hypothetical protein